MQRFIYPKKPAEPSTTDQPSEQDPITRIAIANADSERYMLTAVSNDLHAAGIATTNTDRLISALYDHRHRLISGETKV